jgi:hypothetical protein
MLKLFHDRLSTHKVVHRGFTVLDPVLCWSVPCRFSDESAGTKLIKGSAKVWRLGVWSYH